MAEQQKIAEEAIASILSRQEHIWRNAGARDAAITAAKLVARLAPEAIVQFCDYFAKTQQWGDFIDARWGRKPHWVDDPL